MSTGRGRWVDVAGPLVTAAGSIVTGDTTRVYDTVEANGQ
jgi:hypothetical protein